MNILLQDGLPMEIDGVPIFASYRNMIKFDIATRDDDLSETEKVWMGLRLLFPSPPLDTEKAVKDLLWFYSGGDAKKGRDGSARQPKRAIDFEQDAGAIYAGFYHAYGISLSTVDFLHWWEFMALLEGLPEDTKMSRMMYYRTVDTAGMSASEKKHVAKMRSLFAIKEAAKPMTAEELTQHTKDRVRRRMEEARKAAGKG